MLRLVVVPCLNPHKRRVRDPPPFPITLLITYIGPTGDTEMPSGLHRLATLLAGRWAKVAATERTVVDRFTRRKRLAAPATHGQDIAGLAVRRNIPSGRRFMRHRRRCRSRLNVTHHAVLV